ncbi:hypothetical protein FE257_007953 [Aspergillus nanangensis]|uniref:Uncharacterized protein n=1 Tax=Aspergillus nanangensis TaxID=2582783 RepID=A0AAD4CXA7_ASPNN|nr:hypothetical protein FE257_007953 [Aspergillus nanangensis]
MYQNLDPSSLKNRIKMAKGIFLGKSRRAPDAISNPVLKFTDALPRNDLRDLEQSQDGQDSPRPIHQSHWNFQRPRTSDGRSQSKKTQSPVAGFDFQINVPTPDTIPSSTHTDIGTEGSMIGIALGSPRMVGAQNMMSQMQEKAFLASVAEKNKPAPAQAPSPATAPAPVQRKPSKWKKIGGFFRAKNAMTSTVNQPFYQVRSSSEWPLQRSTHSVDYQNQQEKTAESPPSKPIQNTEVWPCLVTEPEPTPKKPEQPVRNLPEASSAQIAKSKQTGTGTMLDIDIPDVQMERYSVMFGGLLGKGQPSPLNRRSKTLDDITTSHNEETSTLADLPPPRRTVTSPRPKTPSFTLFPTTQATKASKVLGSQNIPRGASPFHRSQTSLVEQPRDLLHNERQSHVFLMVHSPSLKSPSSHKTHHSESSFLSGVSSIDPDNDDEEELLQKIKPVKSYVDPAEEPQWEIISKSPSSSPVNETKQKLLQSLTVNTQELPSETSSLNSASSSPILSPLKSATEKLISPAGSKPGVSPADSTRMPLSDVGDDINEDETEQLQLEHRESIQIPKVEVSIARSISVSKGKKQVIVPIGPRTDRLSPDERLIVRRARTPQVMDAQYRHRHGNSQELRIETV